MIRKILPLMVVVVVTATATSFFVISMIGSRIYEAPAFELLETLAGERGISIEELKEINNILKGKHTGVLAADGQVAQGLVRVNQNTILDTQNGLIYLKLTHYDQDKLKKEREHLVFLVNYGGFIVGCIGLLLTGIGLGISLLMMVRPKGTNIHGG